MTTKVPRCIQIHTLFQLYLCCTRASSRTNKWSSNQLTTILDRKIGKSIYLPEASKSPALSYPCPIRLFEFGSAEAQPPPMRSKREEESSYQTAPGAELLNSVFLCRHQQNIFASVHLQPPYLSMAMNQIKGHNIYVGGLVSPR